MIGREAMETARQPAPALRDRAERHVFATLPELGAAERRVLALLELAGADRAAAARDTGLDAGALREAAARGRKALRRTRAPLAAAGRCERAEMLLSDRLDGGLDDREAGRWLRVHLDRCPRCAEHAALLEEAREALRTAFAAAALPAATPALPPASPRVALVAAPTPPALEEAEPPAALEPPDEPPEIAAAEEPRGRLRPVPPAPPAVAAPEPIAAPAASAVAAPAPRRRLPAGATTRAARVLAIVLVVLAAAAGIAAGISALDDSSRPQRAPWAEPGAPDLPPPPLSGQ